MEQLLVSKEREMRREEEYEGRKSMLKERRKEAEQC